MSDIDVDALTEQVQQKFHLSDDETAELVFPVVEFVAARVEQDVRQQVAEQIERNADLINEFSRDGDTARLIALLVPLARGGSDVG